MAGIDVIESRDNGVIHKPGDDNNNNNNNNSNNGLVKTQSMDETTSSSKVGTSSSGGGSSGRHYQHRHSHSNSRTGHSGNHHNNNHHHYHHNQHSSNGKGMPLTPKKAGRSRHRTNSLSKSLTRASFNHKESSNMDDLELRASESSLLPRISGPHNGNALGSRGDFGLSSGHSNSTLNHLPLTRLAIRGAPSPDGTSKAQNNHLSEPIFEGHPKTPPIPNHGLVNTGCTAPPTSNSRNGFHSNSNNNGISPSSPEPIKTSDTAPLSPVNNSDKPKVKFDKKIMKTLAESEALQLPASPRASKGPQTGEPTTPVPQSRENRNKPQSRRSSSQSLPKLAPPEEPFSIRRKIEQFRKWHEENFSDKLKKFTFEEASNVVDQLKLPDEPTPRASNIDFAKILEENIVQSRNVENEVGGGMGPKHQGQNGPHKTNRAQRTRRASNDEIVTSGGLKIRPTSGTTWKTWRDVNDSDAYTDVRKYIRDNDLMDEEREKWIKLWITDVQSAMEQMEDELLKGAH